LFEKDLSKIEVRIDRVRIAPNGAAQMALGLRPIVVSGIGARVDSIRDGCSGGVFQ